MGALLDLFKRHLRHWNNIDDHSCGLCGEADEDPYHLWSMCPMLTQERTRFNNETNASALEWRLLSFFQSPCIREMEASNEALLVP